VLLDAGKHKILLNVRLWRTPSSVGRPRKAVDRTLVSAFLSRTGKDGQATRGARLHQVAHASMTSTIFGTKNRQTAPPRFLPIASMSPFLNFMEAIPINKGVAANTYFRAKPLVFRISGADERTE